MQKSFSMLGGQCEVRSIVLSRQKYPAMASPVVRVQNNTNTLTSAFSMENDFPKAMINMSDEK